MLLYCTSKNLGHGESGHKELLYIGHSIEEAEEAVGPFKKYRQEQSRWPSEANRKDYTAIPGEMEFEFVRFYHADMWWCSIVMLHLNPEDQPPKEVKIPIKLGDLVVGEATIDRNGILEGDLDAGLFSQNLTHISIGES